MATKINKTKLPKDITDKYTIKNDSFVQVAKSNPKDLLVAEIGDTKDLTKFQPQMKICRWGDTPDDNEVNVSLRLVHDEKTPTVTAEDGKIKWIGDKVEAHWYDINNTDHPEGASEFEVLLLTDPRPKKTGDYQVKFTLVDKGVQYALQPRMDAGQIAEAKAKADGYQNISWFNKEFIDLYYNPNDRKDGYTETTSPDGERPINVVGSYAVYASEEKTNWVGGKEYKTGKVGHIFRPKIIDSAGTEVWGDLHIENGTLSVTIPQEFLDKGIYPIIVDPTFGYNVAGGTDYEPAADSIFASNYNNIIAVGVVVASVSFYGKKEGGDRSSIAAIYEGTTLLSPQSSTLTINSTTAQWWTNTFSGPTLVAGHTYRPAFFEDYVDASNNVHIYRDSGGTGNTVYQNTAYGSWTNPATFSNSSSIYSIYATVTTTPDVIGNPNTGSAGGILVSNTSANFLQGFLYTAPSSGTLASMAVNIVVDSVTKLAMALYDSSRNLIAQTAEINPTTGWNTANFASPPSVTATTQYYLAVWADNGVTVSTTMGYSVGSASQNVYTDNHDYSALGGTFPSPYTAEFSAANNGSIYATYTAAASGPANLKSRSGNLKANIKSLSGNLIANCKSLSGNA